jgi:molybdopterin synthase catalytic subunit
VAEPLTRLELHDGPVPVHELSPAALVAVHHGALASFCGIVRNEHHGRAVTRLHYDCHRPLAMNVLADLSASLRQAFGDDLSISMIHGLGEMVPGDGAIAIHIGAAHRAAALDACREAIEAIKRDLPVWKQEYYDDGSSEWLPGS